MSNPTRALVRVAPWAAPVGPTRPHRLAHASGGPSGPGTVLRLHGHRREPPYPGVPAGTVPTPAHSGRTAAAEPSAPVRPPRRPTRSPVTPPSRPPEAAVPSENPSASGRSGEYRTYAPAVTPDAPRGRDGKEGLNGRADGPAAGDRWRPPGDDGNARRGRWRHHAPPRTAGTPRT